MSGRRSLEQKGCHTRQWVLRASVNSLYIHVVHIFCMGSILYSGVTRVIFRSTDVICLRFQPRVHRILSVSRFGKYWRNVASLLLVLLSLSLPLSHLSTAIRRWHPFFRSMFTKRHTYTYSVFGKFDSLETIFPSASSSSKRSSHHAGTWFLGLISLVNDRAAAISIYGESVDGIFSRVTSYPTASVG